MMKMHPVKNLHPMLLLTATALLLIIPGGNSQEGRLFVFEWPGPIAVPVEFQQLMPPDRVRIVFGREHTDERTLRIQEGVITTFDCSQVLVELTEAGVVNPMFTWSVRIFSNDGIPGPVQGIMDDETYDISGQFMEILNISNPASPSLASEGTSGEYTCEGCGSVFIGVGTGTTICRNSTTRLEINTAPPTIDRRNSTRIFENFRRFYIGNDVCVTPELMIDETQGNLRGRIMGIDLVCVQNQTLSGAIRQDPDPIATWSRNGALIGTTDPIFVLLGDGLQGLGENGVLSINIDTPAEDYVGTFMCNLTNGFGQDSATTILAIADLTASVNNGRSDDGCSRFDGIPSMNRTYCVLPGESVTISCSASLMQMIIGPQGQILTTGQEHAITNAVPTDSGRYTCASGPPCNDAVTFTISVIESGVPEIVEGPIPVTDGADSVMYNIGTDICILRNMPPEIIILCGHDIGRPVNPAPMANWMFPATAQPALSFSDSPLRFGSNDQLTIDNDGDPVTFVQRLTGTYMCNLTSISGFDVSTTVIRVTPNINIGTGEFVPDPPENRVNIGNATCARIDGQPSRLRCIPSELPFTAQAFATRWYLNGEALAFTGEDLDPVPGPGIYTCSKSNECGSVNASSFILGTPSIPTPNVMSPTDAANIVYEVGQAVCIDPSVTGNLQIRCPEPMFPESGLTNVRWTRAGDPSFSVTEAVLTLSRSDPNLVGEYTCTLNSGPNGECGSANGTSSVSTLRSLTEGSGFVSDPMGTLTVGASACFPSAGESLRIRCQVTPSSPALTWSRPDGSIQPESEFIDVVSAGMYTCRAPNGCGGLLEASSVILPINTVSVSATISGRSDNGCSRLNNVPSTADVCPMVGETVTISCVSSSGVYQILREGAVVSSGMPLVLSSFAESDAGAYICTGEANPCSTPIDNLSIFIGGVPPVIFPPGGINPNEGNIPVGQNGCLPYNGEVNISCATQQGTPPITYSWTVNSSSTSFSSNEVISVSELGTYTCTATNVIGSDQSSTTIYEFVDLVFDVLSPSTQSRCSDLVVPPSNTDQCFFVGDTVILSCRSRLTRTPGTIVPDGDVGTKVFREIQESDNGEYTCSLSNPCGNFTSSVILFVQEPARIDRVTPLPPPAEEEVNIGAGRPDDPILVQPNVTVRLFCPFTGIDEPNTRWVIVNGDRSTTNVVEGPNIDLIRENNTIILVIRNFQEADQATYQCLTSNNAGNDDGLVVLRVDELEAGMWWKTPWSQCDPDCHRGMRMRQVTCRGVDTQMLLPDNRCTEEKPLTMEQCLDRGPCFLDPLWVPQEWSQCTKDCGGGYRTRNVICQVPRTQQVLMHNRCDSATKPSTFEYCNLHACCTVDLYPDYCKLICKTPLGLLEHVRRMCCWSCRNKN